jgi:hypothetical protein
LDFSMTGPAIWRLHDLDRLRQLVVAVDGDADVQQLSFIQDLKYLQSLQINFFSGKKPVDGVPDSVQGLDNLQDLILKGSDSTMTPLTDAGLKKLAGLRNLRRLDLTDISGYTDEGLAALMNSSPTLQTVIRTYPASKENKTPNPK